MGSLLRVSAVALAAGVVAGRCITGGGADDRRAGGGFVGEPLDLGRIPVPIDATTPGAAAAIAEPVGVPVGAIAIASVGALAAIAAVAHRRSGASGDAARSRALWTAACAIAAALFGFVRGAPPASPQVPAAAEVAEVEGVVVRAARTFADGDGRAGEALLRLDVGGADGRLVLRLDPPVPRDPEVPPDRSGAPLGADDPPDVARAGPPALPPSLADLLPGDRVRAIGRVRPRGVVANPGAREPPSGAPPSLEILCATPEAVQRVHRSESLRWLPHRVGERTHRVVVERLRAACDGSTRTAGFLACLLVGDRSGVAPSTERAFRDSGTSHLIAVSGLHLVLLAGALVSTLRTVLPSRLLGPVGAPLVVVAVTTFCAACRFEVPVVRSALFLAAAGIARAAGRRGATLDAVALAAVCVLAADPAQVFDAGFHLSFAAVAGLALLTRRFREALFARTDLLARFPEAVPAWSLRLRTAFARGASAALAAHVATAPVVAHHFGAAQPLGPLANLVAVPMFGVALPASAVVAAVGPWVRPVSAPVASALATVLEASVSAFAALPFASIAPGRPPPLLVAGSIVLLVAAARIRPWRAAHALLPAAAWAAVAWVPYAVPRDPGPWLAAFDVGHGTAVLVRSAGGADVLFDAGGRAPATGSRIIVPALQELRVRRLAALFLSHEDADHIDGAPDVLRDVPPDVVVVPEGFGASPIAAALLAECRAAGVPVLGVRRGDVWSIEGLRVQVLGPTSAAPAGAENADSLVAHVSAAGPVAPLTALVPGDLEAQQLLDLTSGDGPPRADVLLLPHHGRGDPALHRALADRCGAQVRIASTSAAAPTGDPAAWVTGLRGAVRVRAPPAAEGWPW